jgi:hypothetical protein
LLQYALTELFEERQNGRLSLDVYREGGGVAGSLARRAEALYASLDRAGKRLTQQVFQRLLSLGGASEERRRRVARSELRSLADKPSEVDQIIDTFGDHRLLTFDQDPESRAPTVEIAHEALLREWKRLRNWIDAGREDLILQRRLASLVNEWLREDRDPEYLLRGTRLEQFESWAESTDLMLTPTEQEFLRASIEARDIRREEEASRQAKEKALERRAINRLRAFVGVLAFGIIAAVGLSAVALNERQVAQREARIANARELAAASRAALAVDTDLSILLALESVNTTYAADNTVLPEAEEALHLAIQRSRLGKRIDVRGDGCYEVTQLNSVGSRLLAWDCNGFPGIASLWDSSTGEHLYSFEDQIPVAFSLDGKRFATANLDFGSGVETFTIWDSASGDQTSTYQIPMKTSPDGFVLSLGGTLDPDLRIVARYLDDGESEAWDLYSGEKLLTSGTEGSVPNQAVTFSNDSSLLAMSNGEHSVEIWDPLAGEQLLDLLGHSALVHALAFSPDGDLLASGSGDGTVRLWDVLSGDALVTLNHVNELRGLAFSRDGNLLATANWLPLAKKAKSYSGT